MSTEPRQKRALSGPTMGTRWSAVFYPPARADTDHVAAALAEAVDRVDCQMSTWKPESDLMRLNRTSVGDWEAVPDELAYVLAVGLGIQRESGGCFDMSVFREVEAWGFGPSRSSGQPARAPRNPQPRESLEIDPASGRARRLADVTFDLSGIAKGFAVDLMARALEGEGIADYLVAIDGELQAGGSHPDDRPWQVGLEAPQIERRDVAQVLNLADCSLATSGDYRHRRQVGDRWVSHTIDPRTGGPVENQLASVSVRMTDCIAADAWATALLVAGETVGPELARAQGIDAIFVRRAAGDAIVSLGTGCFSGIA